MKRLFSSLPALLFPALLALASCEKKPEAVADPDAATLQGLRAAANNEGYCRTLAAQPGSGELAKQDLQDASKRLSVLEDRALNAGVSSTKIDAEISAGEGEGNDRAKKTLEDRIARKAADAAEKDSP